MRIAILTSQFTAVIGRKRTSDSLVTCQGHLQQAMELSVPKLPQAQGSQPSPEFESHCAAVGCRGGPYAFERMGFEARAKMKGTL
jgi:hypothetical protein